MFPRFIDESPRWLIVHGRSSEALQVLKKVSRWHDVDLPPKTEMEAILKQQDTERIDGEQQFSVGRILRSLVAEILVLFR